MSSCASPSPWHTDGFPRTHIAEEQDTTTFTSTCRHAAQRSSSSKSHRSPDLRRHRCRLSGRSSPDPPPQRPYHRQGHAQTHPEHPHHITSTSLEQCREALLKVFRYCTDHDFRQVSCVISCVLTARRPLKIQELVGAVKLSTWMLQQQFPLSIPSTSTQDNSAWLRYFRFLLKTNVEGQVSFKQHAMAFFLQRFRIEGIDTSHRTIALLCNGLNEFEGFVPDTEMNGQAVSQRTTSSFATYASKHSQYHYHIASKSSLCLRTDSSWKDIPTIRRPSFLVLNPMSRAEDESDFEVIEKEFGELKIDAESQDWIFVDSA